MRRLSLAAIALMAGGAFGAQRVDVDPSRRTDFRNPLPIQQGDLVASEISDTDFDAGPDWRAETFVFEGRAGEVITAQVRSDLPDLLVRIVPANTHTGRGLAESPAAAEPLRHTLKKDGRYFLVVHAKGPRHQGKYLLAFGAGDDATALLDAEAESKPLVEPELPEIPGVATVRKGQVVSRPAGAAGPGVESFRFLAGMGDHVRAMVSGTGELVLQAYSTEGESMLSTVANDTAALDFVAPVDGIYYLSVTRADGAKDYSLKLDIDEKR